MSNAYGGIVNITLIVVFLVIVSGYLAFSVNYNKAFRVKNKIISSIEECEGIENSSNDCAVKKIEEYMKNVGYSMAKDWKIDGYTCRQGFCYLEVTESQSEEMGNRVYYNVTTAVNIDMPILNRILPNMKIFQVSGTTKVIIKQ